MRNTAPATAGISRPRRLMLDCISGVDQCRCARNRNGRHGQGVERRLGLRCRDTVSKPRQDRECLTVASRPQARRVANDPQINRPAGVDSFQPGWCDTGGGIGHAIKHQLLRRSASVSTELAVTKFRAGDHTVGRRQAKEAACLRRQERNHHYDRSLTDRHGMPRLPGRNDGLEHLRTVSDGEVSASTGTRTRHR